MQAFFSRSRRPKPPAAAPPRPAAAPATTKELFVLTNTSVYPLQIVAVFEEDIKEALLMRQAISTPMMLHYFNINRFTVNRGAEKVYIAMNDRHIVGVFESMEDAQGPESNFILVRQLRIQSKSSSP